MTQISALNKRRWHNFRSNKRAYWSLVLFSICFFISLFAELIANDKTILVKYRGEYVFPIANFYPELNIEYIHKDTKGDIDLTCLLYTSDAADE